MKSKELSVLYRKEQKEKRARASRWTPVRFDPLTEVPQISLQYVVGGGWQYSHDYRVVGGPDDGKRVTLLYWEPADYLKYGAKVYNGTPEEYEESLGYSCRPMIECSQGLHVSTVMYLVGHLETRREHDQAKHYVSRLDKEIEAARAE